MHEAVRAPRQRLVKMSIQAQLAAVKQYRSDYKAIRGVLQPNTCHGVTHGHEQRPVNDRQAAELLDHYERLQCQKPCRATVMPSTQASADCAKRALHPCMLHQLGALLHRTLPPQHTTGLRQNAYANTTLGDVHTSRVEAIMPPQHQMETCHSPGGKLATSSCCRLGCPPLL